VALFGTDGIRGSAGFADSLLNPKLVQEIGVATGIVFNYSFQVVKRTAPTVSFWAENGTATNVTMPDVSAAVACTSATRISETGFGAIILSSANTASRIAGCHWTATSEL
jgi:hypothetical protein